MNNKITEEKMYEIIEDIIFKHKECNKKGNSWFEQFRYTDCKIQIIREIQSLITSIKQEERDRFINLIPNKMRLAVGTHNLFEKGYNSTIDEINEAIQSLTEEDGKEEGK